MNLRKSLAALAVSATLVVSVATFEGYRGEAYIPVKGDVPTIGHGTTKGVRMGDRITPERAMSLLLEDLNSHSAGISKCIEVPLYQREFDAYSSLAYNIGVHAFCGSTLVRKLNSQDYVGACTEIQKWNRAGGRVLPGLVKRRYAEYRMCIGPVTGT